MWWSCPKARKYWSMIYEELLKIQKIKIVKLPELMLLGLKLDEINVKDRTSMWYLLTAGRILYASLWKQEEAPNLERWIINLMNIIEMDKITRKLRMKDQSEFQNCWQKVKDYITNNWIDKKFLRVFDWNELCLTEDFIVKWIN